MVKISNKTKTCKRNAGVFKRIFIYVYLNTLAFSSQFSLIVFKCFLKQWIDSDESFIFRWLSISLLEVILNTIIDLLTLDFKTMLKNRSFSLNFGNI